MASFKIKKPDGSWELIGRGSIGDVSLLTKTVNMLNPDTCTDGYIITNSGLTATTGYSCSDYIAVDGSKTYSFRGKYAGGVQLCLYDEDKNYIKQLYENEVTSGSYSSGYMTLDLSATYPNTRYVRANMSTSAIGTVYMFVEGDVYPSEYVAYVEPGFKDDEINKYIQAMIAENQNVKIGTEEVVAGTSQQTISIGNDAGGNGNGGISIGTGAMQSLAASDGTDNGRYNTAVGHQAMREATTADHSTAVGYQALRGCTTGDYNTAVGEDAAMTIGAGNRNVAIGCRAMQSRTSGDDNVAVGALATYFDDANHPTGSRNTAIGARAGDSGGSASDCVHIGYGAKNIEAGYDNTIIIGSGAQATKANQAVIGNSTTVETVVRGDLIVRGTDGTRKKIIFNDDGTCTWETVQ